ncbi:MAG: hypoxanthine phosphoribosyltransferase, partial [Bacteroidaceae bacterium]|nr:hypoxanthine phosphoribosyltransferase [Bacteroidaceae bacterium]
MDNIKVLDKTFAISIPESRIKERVAELGAAISRDLEGKNPIFLAVLNGSFVFAADLLRAVSIPCEISFIRLASYIGTSSTGNVKEVMGLTEDLEGRTVVVVEDIIDSG